MSEKIVKKGEKIDFHIHSFASYHKDNSKVKDGTIDKIDNLVTKLLENDVNMCSITDHDNFDYDLYAKLKEEEAKDNCIKKVIPGVEFSVIIDGVDLHIIALFDDEQPEKVKNIQSFIFDTKTNKPKYNNGILEYFTEDSFLDILRNIDLNVVLIAHQKNSLSSKRARKHDANNLPEEKFNELIFLEYFEALEFKNKKNEIFNNNYLKNNKEKLKNVNFITGSDCHNWSNYPEISNDEEFSFSFFKCLPTFRGIMMSITDPRRIKIGVDSFFSKNNSIDKINILIDKKEYDIELSEGINAIIGDNSIGKSLLLHKITEYSQLNKKSLISAYEKYLLENKIDIKTVISPAEIRHFDKQGNIREMFTNNKTKSRDFLNDYYPVEPNYNNIKTILKDKLSQFINFLYRKQEIINEEKKIININLEFFEDQATSLQIENINIDLNANEKSYNDLLIQIEKIIKENIDLLKNYIVTEEEKKNIGNYNNFLTIMQKKYQDIKSLILIEKEKINIINEFLTELSENLTDLKTGVQKERERYNRKFIQLESTLSNLISLNYSRLDFSIEIEEKKLFPTINLIGDYRFVCKSSIQLIDTDYVRNLLLSPLSPIYSKQITDFNKIDPEAFENNIKKAEDEIDKLLFYKQKVVEKIESDFKIIYSINNKADKDVTKDLSAGANAKIYFELLSKDTTKQGIYIIDQPEDDVSQPSIKSKLLANFKNIAQNRQVLMITHNPQFIINLDVDNVIFIRKNEDSDTIEIINGALEYKDQKDDILNIVADNIEGGIDSIRERYKKYEKNY